METPGFRFYQDFLRNLPNFLAEVISFPGARVILAVELSVPKYDVHLMGRLRETLPPTGLLDEILDQLIRRRL